jgi:hypothetical protein
VWPLFLIRPRSYSPRTFGADGLSETLESKDHRRNHLPKAQSTGAKGYSCRRGLSNALRIEKAVVPACTNRVDDRPYQHRVDVECATPAACREADMSVKACNGSDGQDATVEAPGRRLRIGYVGFFHISRALYRRCSASSSPRQLLACPWGAEADRAVDRQRRCSPRLFISAPSPADSHSGIDLATPNLLNHPECPPEARSSPSRAAATARFAADSPLEGTGFEPSVPP